MVHLVAHNDLEYPFFFGMREVYALTQSRGIEYHEVDQSLSMNFDVMLEIYHLASKKGVRKYAKEQGEDTSQYKHLELSMDQIEDFIDEDPEFFVQLEEVFQNSTVVKRIFDEAEEAEKKIKSPSRS